MTVRYKAISVLLAVSVAISTLGGYCYISGGSSSGIFVGSATYWVEFWDWVIDWQGKRQRTLCSNYVTFTGDIDGRCSFYPMTWSYARYSWMDCFYTDSLGQPWWYTDYYYFQSGYIQEPACFATGYATPTAADNPDPLQQSRLERDGDGAVVLDESIELGDEQTPLARLRELVAERLDPPEVIPTDAGEEPVIVRTSEVREDGEPVQDISQ